MEVQLLTGQHRDTGNQAENYLQAFFIPGGLVYVSAPCQHGVRSDKPGKQTHY